MEAARKVSVPPRLLRSESQADSISLWPRFDRLKTQVCEGQGGGFRWQKWLFQPRLEGRVTFSGAVSVLFISSVLCIVGVEPTLVKLQGVVTSGRIPNH